MAMLVVRVGQYLTSPARTTIDRATGSEVRL
jgi:hypothetical protein